MLLFSLLCGSEKTAAPDKVDKNLQQKRNEHSRLLFSECRSVSEVFFASSTPFESSFYSLQQYLATALRINLTGLCSERHGP